MDTLERALINLGERGFERGFECESHVSFSKMITGYEGRIDFLNLEPGQLHPRLQVITNFYKNSGNYLFIIMGMITDNSTKPRIVKEDARQKIEDLVSRNVGNDKIQEILDDFKRELELPEGVEIFKPMINVGLDLSLCVEGTDFEKTYERFKLTAERLGYKID